MLTDGWAPGWEEAKSGSWKSSKRHVKHRGKSIVLEATARTDMNGIEWMETRQEEQDRRATSPRTLKTMRLWTFVFHALNREVTTRLAFWKGNFGSGVEGKEEVKAVAGSSGGKLEM